MIIEYRDLIGYLNVGGPLYGVKPERQYCARVIECSAQGCRYSGHTKHDSTSQGAREMAVQAWRVHVRNKHRTTS